MFCLKVNHSFWLEKGKIGSMLSEFMIYDSDSGPATIFLEIRSGSSQVRKSKENNCNGVYLQYSLWTVLKSEQGERMYKSTQEEYTIRSVIGSATLG